MTNQRSNSKTSKGRIRQCESASWEHSESLKTERLGELMISQGVIQVGKSNGLLHFVWKSSDNMAVTRGDAVFFQILLF